MLNSVCLWAITHGVTTSRKVSDMVEINVMGLVYTTFSVFIGLSIGKWLAERKDGE